MADVKDKNSLSPGGQSDNYEYGNSSADSARSSTVEAIRVSIALHEQNGQLLREKQNTENMHNQEINALQHEIKVLKGRIAELSSVNAAEQRLRVDEAKTWSDEKCKLQEQLAEYKEKFVAQEALIQQSRLFEEENETKNRQMHDLKQTVADLREELAEKIGEILSLNKDLDPKDCEIAKLKEALSLRDERISHLQKERDANNARMQAVKDVQMAYEDLRKNNHEKDRHVRDLEDVLDRTMREQQHLSSIVLKLQEESRQKEQEFNEFKSEADRRYEDTCQQYVVQLDALHSMSFGAKNYPGKSDNVVNMSISNASGDSCHQNCSIDVPDGSINAKTKLSSSSPSFRRSVSTMAHESALRTMKILRSEYEIERQRNTDLQQEIIRLNADRERLYLELYGEVQNCSLSSLNCTLLAQNGERRECDSPGGFIRRFKCLRQELETCISERDTAKTDLLRVRADLDQALARYRNQSDRSKRYEAELEALRCEDKKQLRQYQCKYVVANNRMKALIYQKVYLQREVAKLRKVVCLDHCNTTSKLDGVPTLPSSILENGELAKGISSYLDLDLCPHPATPARIRFKVAVYVVIAAVRIVRLAQRKKRWYDNAITQ